MLTKSRRRDLLKLAAGTLTIAASLPTTAVSLSTSSAAQWRSDLDHLYLQLQTHHRDLFNRSDRPAFDSAVAALRRDIPGMREHEVIAGFQRLTALAGDGHTFIFAWDRYQPLPFDVAWFDDGVRVVRTTPAAAELLGVTIQRLDGMEMREVEQRLDTVIAQGENAWYILAQRPNRLRRAGLLAALGIAKSMDGVVIEGIDREGRHRTVEVSALPLGSPDDSMTSSLGPDAPRKPDSSFAWTRLPQHDAMHVAFRSYADLPTKAEALFHAIKHDAPATLIIDLRENGGGNYILPRAYLIPNIQALRANKGGRLFVLVGRHTFSAAMVNALDLRRETEALLVGEPMGARPNGFQELHTFMLPHSRLKVACAIRRYRFGEPGMEAVHPDIAAPPEWQLVVQGRDPALEAALAKAARS